MSTTNPVVADSVMVRVVRERQEASASPRGCTTASWPKGAFNMRTVASARVSSGSVISMTPAPAPKVVSGCVGPSRSIRRRPTMSSSGRRRRQHRAVGIGEQKAAPGGGGPRRQRMRQHFLRARQGIGWLFQRLRQPFGGKIGERVERRHRVVERLPAVVEHLHHGADANGGEKGDNQHRHRAAQAAVPRSTAVDTPDWRSIARGP